MQLKLIEPTYIILDEIDSGLDVDAFKIIVKMLADFSGPERSITVITHYFEILESIPVDQVIVMRDGIIERSGGQELATEIREKGFNEV